MPKWLKPTGWKIGLACALFTLGLWASGLAFLHDIELKTVDARFRLRGPRAVSGDVVIAVIDSRSIDALGRWPWPRSDMARLIGALHEMGARVIALDIVFAEPERDHPEHDRMLATAVRRAGNVVLGYYFRLQTDRLPGGSSPFLPRREPGAPQETLDQRLKLVAPSLLSQVRISRPPRSLQGCEDVEPNIPEIGASSDAMGFFSIQPDSDGVLRRAPAMLSCGSDYYASLSLRAATRFLGDPPVRLELAEDGVRRLMIGERRIPADETGAFRVNFPGPGGSFAHYPVIDILRNNVRAGAFRGKVVLVGPTELGIEDIRATPYSPVVPGVEVQAAAVETLLHGPFIHRSNVTTIVDILAVLVMGLGLGAILGRLPRAVHRFEGMVLAALILVYGSLQAFSRLGVQMNMLYPGVCLGLTYLGVALYEAFGVERQGREIRKLFETYVSPSVVETMVREPERILLGGERRDITILFSDIEGFTTLSERLPPEEVVALLNAYLTPMTDIVFRHKGTLDKYIGDAVMALYGAPLDLPDHADRACRAALDMMSALGKLKDDAWFARGWPDLRIRIGVNSGIMAIGNMGSNIHKDYTAIGDGVNLASRLEGQNKSYGTRILISEFTKERLAAPFVLREIDVVRVRGKQEPVRVYELRGEGTPVPEEASLIRLFEEGLACLRSARREDARERFQGCLVLAPDDVPARIMLARCDEQPGASEQAPGGLASREG